MEDLITQQVSKALYTLSNIFAESDLATKATTSENISLFSEFIIIVTQYISGNNYKTLMDEVFFVLSNLLTECDKEHLYKTMVVEDPTKQKIDEIITHSIKALEYSKVDKKLVPQIIDMMTQLLLLGGSASKEHFVSCAGEELID